MAILKTTRDGAMIDTVKAMAYSASTLLEQAHAKTLAHMNRETAANDPDRDTEAATTLGVLHNALCEVDVIAHYVSIWGDDRKRMEHFIDAIRGAWTVIQEGPKSKPE